MPLEDDYVEWTEQEIIDILEDELRDGFGADIDLTTSSVFLTLSEVMAALSKNQEGSIKDVYESGFLDTAQGQNLDNVVAIIGINRRSAIHSTGSQRFLSESAVTSNYTIQKGVNVQTRGDNPIQFETTQTATLKYLDGFESGSLSNYSGDVNTGTFSTVSTHPFEGSTELEAGPTADEHIYNTNVSIRRGSKTKYHVYAETDTIPTITFGIQDANNYYQAVIDTSLGELRIEKVESGSVTQTINTQSHVIPENEYLSVELDWNLTDNISLKVIDDNDTEYTVGGVDSDEEPWIDGFYGFKSLDSTGSKYWDEVGQMAVTANIRAKNGGATGNVGANSITVLPSPPAGVSSTTNIYPTGEYSQDGTGGDAFVIGQDREEDDELRERARNSVSSGGDATAEALISEVLNEVDGVTSVTLFENKTDTTNGDGLPPKSFEMIVFGGGSKEIADTIFDKKAVTSNDIGGIRGTEVTETVTAESNSQQFEIDFSRPSKLSVSMTMDIVVNDTYIGDSKIEDLIVDYIGGINNNSSESIGLGVGEDIYVDQIEDIVVGSDETGVIGFNTTASSDDIVTTPSTTTDGNGLQIVSVGANEVAYTDATENDITINTTEI